MRLAFVTPRYGADLVGGAEAQVREAAHGLAARGHEVDVLTTVATDAQTWASALDSGVTEDGDITVRRFDLVPGTDAARRDALDHLVRSGRTLALEDELAWADARFQSPAMVRYLTEKGGGYDAVAYSPYLFWTTLRCLPLTRARSILIPCLHDEPLARLRIARATLAGAAETWFLSEPEHRLAHRLAPLGPHRVVGSAVHEPTAADPGAFRARHGLTRPYALYAGRREDGKGWPQAVAGFSLAVDRHTLDLDLVTVGSGAVRVTGPGRDRVVDLGFLDQGDVSSAFAAASVFLQPSPNESFSRTVMEAWLAGLPVVATAAGDVVAWHCERSGGGILYGDDLELAQCIRALAQDPSAAAELGEAGRRYVRAECTWPAVLDRMEEALAAFGRPERGSAAVRLEAEVRAQAVADRRAELPVAPGLPLAPWLPAPGAGLRPSASVAAAVGAASPAVAAAPAGPHRRGRMFGAASRALRRFPTARRLAVAVRAGRAAWVAGGAVAPTRDVR